MSLLYLLVVPIGAGIVATLKSFEDLCMLNRKVQFFSTMTIVCLAQSLAISGLVAIENDHWDKDNPVVSLMTNHDLECGIFATFMCFALCFFTCFVGAVSERLQFNHVYDDYTASWLLWIGVPLSSGATLASFCISIFSLAQYPTQHMISTAVVFGLVALMLFLLLCALCSNKKFPGLCLCDTVLLVVLSIFLVIALAVMIVCKVTTVSGNDQLFAVGEWFSLVWFALWIDRFAIIIERYVPSPESRIYLSDDPETERKKTDLYWAEQAWTESQHSV